MLLEQEDIVISIALSRNAGGIVLLIKVILNSKISVQGNKGVVI